MTHLKRDNSSCVSSTKSNISRAMRVRMRNFPAYIAPQKTESIETPAASIDQQKIKKLQLHKSTSHRSYKVLPREVLQQIPS